MMYLKNICFILILTSAGFTAFGQESHQLLRDGNKAYTKENYADAEIKYREVLDNDQLNYKATFNLGNSLYKQKKYKEAEKSFNNLESPNISKTDKADAFYNLGNTFMQMKEYQKAAEAYKKALLNNPDDDDTRYNYIYARQKIKQQQQQQKKQDKQDKQDKQNQNGESQKDNNQHDQQKSDNNKDEQEQSARQEKDQQAQKPEKGKMSEKQAERMMQALENDQKKLMKKILRKKEARTKTIEKDW